jgi:hypothetical protein
MRLSAAVARLKYLILLVVKFRGVAYSRSVPMYSFLFPLSRGEAVEGVRSRYSIVIVWNHTNEVDSF